MPEEILKTYLPLLLSGLFSVLAWSINRHLKNIEKIADKIEKLQDIVIRNETTTKIQQEIIMEHIKSLSKVDTKLDAVFRYIDAPTRSTDSHR